MASNSTESEPAKQRLYITIGIDVGGTNTDCAIREDSGSGALNVLAVAKHATTRDVTSGIVGATNQSLKIVYESYKDRDIYINNVSIGTTHFVNAIEQRSDKLSEICVIRLCGAVSRAFPPFINIPSDLAAAINCGCYMIDGGYDYNGKVVAELESKENDTKITKIAADIKSNGVKSIAITGIFSPMNGDQEIKLQQILTTKLGADYARNTHFTLSHHIAGLGLLQRENAAILNATISALAAETIASFQSAMSTLGITSPLYLTKNDGTQCRSEDAVKYPITTFASGPTNSMKGAAVLYDQHDAVDVDDNDISNDVVLVCDIGGTTADIGMLENGFLQLSATKCKMAGIETNFAVPNVVSRALGGGTIIDFDADTQIVLNVGPQSVGYDLKRSMCFEGGDQNSKCLTLTDVAVFGGHIESDALSATYGQKVNVKQLDGVKKVIGQSKEMMLQKFTEMIDTARGEKENLVLLLCGGGAALIPSDFEVEGIDKVVVPDHANVANAIGAASSQISGHLDVMHKFEGLNRDQEIEKLKQMAMDKAIENGAKKETVSIATFESIPIAYIPGDFQRILIKAVGDVDSEIVRKNAQKWTVDPNQWKGIESLRTFTENSGDGQVVDDQKETITEQQDIESKEENENEKETARNLSEDGSVWTLSIEDIDYLSIGCGVIGTGGGGSTGPFDILCKEYLNSGHSIRIIDPDAVDPNCNVLCVAFMGAPAMLSEKLMNGSELLGVIERMAEHLKIHEKKEKLAIICGEIGGCNGLIPIIAAAQYAVKYGTSIDIVDGDFMGRAFPELQHCLPSIMGKAIAPVSCQDEYGNNDLLEAEENDTNQDIETKMRIKCVAMGMKVAISMCPLKGKDLGKYIVPRTYTLSWNIGRVISLAKGSNQDPLRALRESEHPMISKAQIVYYGNIIGLHRKNEGGFSRGTVQIQGIEDGMNNGNDNGYIEADSVFIEIQNENLILRTSDKVLVTVPDMITLLDDEYNPIFTEELRYGLRATVIVFPAHSFMKTKEALSVIGPAAFGYQDMEYIPYGDVAL